VHLYVVTNRHVVEGGCSVARLTSRQHESVVKEIATEEWIYPVGGDDIAAWHMGAQAFDHDNEFACIVIPNRAVGEIRSYGPGDDCFMVGRIVTKDGLLRNTPSARFGNISMLPEEQFERRTDVWVDAFLVETRSQAGYSGSPVFVYRKKMTVEMPIREKSEYKPGIRKIDLSGSEHLEIRLLGIDFAHIPNRARIGQLGTDFIYQHPDLPDDARVELGSGMLAVATAWKLIEMLNRSDVQSLRETPGPMETAEKPVIDL